MNSQIYNQLFMGFKHKRNILLERERQRGKRDGREERQIIFYLFILFDCVIYIIWLGYMLKKN